MELYLEILDGPAKGSRTPLREGLTIGRRDCDVNLDDSKVSGKHARLELRSDGTFWLIDSGSANGIRVGSGKVTEVALDPGVDFKLGRTSLKVGGKKTSTTWRKTIMALTERGIKESAPTSNREAVVALKSPLKMTFTRGLQVGQEWTIGYGPREIGSSSVDLPLHEPGAPPKCFRLLPRDGETIVRVHEDASKKVLLNGKPVETAFLRTGDVIEIGNTRIEISFI